jgi:hypothetical protein
VALAVVVALVRRQAMDVVIPVVVARADILGPEVVAVHIVVTPGQMALVVVVEVAATLAVAVVLVCLVKVVTEPLAVFLVVYRLKAVGVLVALMVQTVQVVHMVAAAHLPEKSINPVALEPFVLFGVSAAIVALHLSLPQT